MHDLGYGVVEHDHGNLDFGTLNKVHHMVFTLPYQGTGRPRTEESASRLRSRVRYGTHMVRPAKVHTEY